MVKLLQAKNINRLLSMRATQTKKSKKNIIIILVLIIAVGAIATALIYNHQSKTSRSSKQSTLSSQENDNTPTSSGTNSDTEQKQQAADDETKNNSNNSPATPSNPSFSDNNISFTTQNTNGSLVVTTKLQGFSGSGTCNLVLKNDDSSVTESAEVIYQEEYSSCAGFSIPLSSVQRSGTWNITLSVTTNSGTFSKTGIYIR